MQNYLQLPNLWIGPFSKFYKGRSEIVIRLVLFTHSTLR